MQTYSEKSTQFYSLRLIRPPALALVIWFSLALTVNSFEIFLSPRFTRLSPATTSTSNDNFYINPLYNIEHAIPGEIIVRFETKAAAVLLLELENPYNPYSENAQLPTLIGRRVEATVLRQAAPQLTELFERYGVVSGQVIDPILGTYLLKATPNTAPVQMLVDFRASHQFVYVEPNFPIMLMRDPNDPFYRAGNQYALRNINAAEAWDITTGADDITVAVLDSGVAALHPDLEGKVLAGLNFASNPPNLSTLDDQGHGTFVAGIIAAKTDNNVGVAGLAWGARILPVKVLSANGEGSAATAAMGINYATERKVQIMNLSLGAPDRSQVVYDAVMKAYQAGIVLIAASGNNGRSDELRDKPQYPAAFDEVITVGAVTSQDTPADFTSIGPHLSLSAPGTAIFSLSWAGSLYGYNNGTSFAAPFVSGTVALMLSVNRNLTNAQIRQILENTVDVPNSVVPVFSPTVASSVAPLTVTTTRSSVTATATIRPGITPTATPIGLAFTPVTAPSTSSPAATALVTPPTSTPAPALDTSTPTANNTPFFDPRIGWGRLNTLKAVQAAQRNQVFSSRRAQVQGTIVGKLEPEDVIVTLAPGDSRIPNANGTFSFSNLPPGNYRLSVSSPKYGLPNRNFTIAAYTFRVNGGESLSYNFDFTTAINAIINAGPPLAAFARVNSGRDPNFDRYFPETGHVLSGEMTGAKINGSFRYYWETNGGLPVFGYPISEEFLEDGLWVQYFERVVFQRHPEYYGTRFSVLIRLLGTERIQNRPEPAFKRVNPPTQEELDKELIYYWDVTGHSLRGSFLRFWAENGGLLNFGYPISEPLQENGRLVQYFERYRFELYPEFTSTAYQVQGTLLARNHAIENKYMS